MSRATDYNHNGQNRIWHVKHLPEHMQEMVKVHGSGSQEFADMVLQYQKALGLEEDGKLGPLTYEAMATQYGSLRKVSAAPEPEETWSPLIARIQKTKRKLRKRKLEDVVGVVVHTTGRGIVGKAVKKKKDPFQYALDYYCGPKAYTSHYLMGWDGSVVGIVPEDERAYHAGVSTTRKNLYKAGLDTWTRWLKPLNAKKPPNKGDIVDRDGSMVLYGRPFGGYAQWKRRWAGVTDNPRDIMKDPNGQSIGLDLLPAPKDKGGVHPGGFTDDQQAALPLFLSDCRRRYGRKLILVGHSDVDPITRTNSNGSWDPMCIGQWEVFDEVLAQLR